MSLPSGISYPSLKTEQYYPLMGGWIRYGQSKLANILYAKALAKNYPGIKTLVIHPGIINTELVSGLSFAQRAFILLAKLGTGYLTEEQGAYNSVWAATAKKDEVKTGEFYIPVGKRGPYTKLIESEKNAKELWDWTQGELAKF